MILYSPLLFSNPHIVQNQAGIPEYICQVNYQCLDHLNNVLLNKESDKSIYKYCKTTLDNTKLCCADPSQCKEPWGKEFAKSLRERSLKKVQNSGGDPLSCELNKLSNLISSLSKTQNKVCNTGLKKCNVGCENKLREVTKTFRKCFSISNRYSIKKALEKMQSHPIVEQACFRKMYEVVEKYKKQSLDEKFLFREKLETKDIVNCEEIKDINTKSSLNNFALSMCYQAQTQKQNEKKEKIERIEKETRETQVEPIPLKPEETQVGQVPLEVKAGRPFPSAASPSSMDEDNLEDETQNAESHSESPPQEISGGKLSKEGQLNELKAIFGESLSSSSSGNRYEGAFNKEVESGSIAGNVSPHLNRNSVKTKKTNTPPQTFVKRVSNRTKIVAGRVVKKAKETVNKIKEKIEQRKKEKEGHLQITHQLVYQSVAAPQVEPFHVQEPQNDIEFPIFKSYDLVKGKPAGVLIQIQYQFPKDCLQNVNSNECVKQRNFNLKLEVRNQGVETKCVPMKKTEKEGWQFHSSSELSNQACAFSTVDFSFEEPVIYKFIELNTTKMASVELEKYIDVNTLTNTGHHSGFFETPASHLKDKTILPINTENSHIPVRVNIVEKGKVIKNELSIKPTAESKLSLGNCGNNIDLNAPNEFCLNVLELEGVSLGFIRITGDRISGEKQDNCYLTELAHESLNGYPSVDSKKLKNFIISDETTTFLPYLLPLSELQSSVLMTKKEKKDFILGNCDNSMIPRESFYTIVPQTSMPQGHRGARKANPFSGKSFSEGLLKDIRNLQMERAEWRGTGKYDKLFAVVSTKYLLYHNLHESLDRPKSEEIYGFSFFPESYETSGKSLQVFNHYDHPWTFLGDVAFIREDQVDKGTFSHELAHLLGQKKDFYNIDYPGCRPFGGSLKEIPLRKCSEYKIYKALETLNEDGKTSWNFITDRYSIMDNKKDIEILWIDRESHQRIFSVIAKVSRVIKEKKQKLDRQLGYSPQASPLKKILVAGFYHKEQNHFAVPKVKSIETSFLTSYPKQPVENGENLTFQLKDKNQVLQEISRPVYKTRLGFLHKKGHSKNTSCKAVPFDFSYLDAIFSIPWHKKLENLRIVVLGPQKNEIFSSSIPKAE